MSLTNEHAPLVSPSTDLLLIREVRFRLTHKIAQMDRQELVDAVNNGVTLKDIFLSRYPPLSPAFAQPAPTVQTESVIECRDPAEVAQETRNLLQDSFNRRG